MPRPSACPSACSSLPFSTTVTVFGHSQVNRQTGLGCSCRRVYALGRQHAWAVLGGWFMYVADSDIRSQHARLVAGGTEPWAHVGPTCNIFPGGIHFSLLCYSSLCACLGKPFYLSPLLSNTLLPGMPVAPSLFIQVRPGVVGFGIPVSRRAAMSACISPQFQDIACVVSSMA